MLPAIFGLSGPELTSSEAAFLASANPVGVIIFKRNIVSRDQLRALTYDIRAVTSRADMPILIDQEGGRVSRLHPPLWPDFPTAERFDQLYSVAPMSAIEAARVNSLAIALTLSEVGISVNAAPVLDVRVPGTHAALADRTLGSDALRVASLGRAVLDGLREGGVIGIVKHMPGQGRAVVDSHTHLPRVTATSDELSVDLAPFASLATAVMGMTGHVLYEIWDKDRPATLSPVIIDTVIRAQIGFDGLLISDDIAMDALHGAMAERAAACITAGCDVALHCNGRIEEMESIAERLPPLTAKGAARLDAALATVQHQTHVPDSIAALTAKRDQLLGYG